MTFKEKITFALALPFEQKLWLLSFFLGSLICWFAVRMIPARKLAAKMGDQYLQHRQLSVITSEQQANSASKMGKLMASVSKNVPWESKCLTEALCVKWLLNRYQIPAVFYLGARLEPDTNTEKMAAHAWLSVGPYVVTGAPAHLDFNVVATFVSPKLESPH